MRVYPRLLRFTVLLVVLNLVSKFGRPRLIGSGWHASLSALGYKRHCHDRPRHYDRLALAHACARPDASTMARPGSPGRGDVGPG